MKNITYIIIALLALITLFSCEQEDILFSDDMSNVGFYKSSANMMEFDKDLKGKDTLTIQVLVTATPGSPACKVSFDVDQSWYEEKDGKYILAQDSSINVNPAFEGVDFEIISSKEITVEEGYGYADVIIAAIDNNSYDENGNKSFQLKITGNNQNYDLASAYTTAITIIDDDHPLGWMLGDYTSAVTETANGSTSHPVSISAVEGETDKIKIYGMAGAALGPPLSDPYYILGTVSEDYSTVTIKAGQEWESWNYGPVRLDVWEDDNGDGEEVDELVGSISTDGGVTITFSQQYTFMITDGSNEGLGLQWAFNSDEEPNSPTAIWTRQ